MALLLGHWLFGLGDAIATICAAMSFDEPFRFEKSAGYMPWQAQGTWNCGLADVGLESLAPRQADALGPVYLGPRARGARMGRPQRNRLGIRQEDEQRR